MKYIKKWLLLLLIPLFVQANKPLLSSEKIPKARETAVKNKRVLISGAGIAGLTLAYWLKQYGFVPTIIERHKTLRTGGYKIDIRGVALDVIKKMGLHSTIFDARTDIIGATLVSNDGKDVKDVSPDLTGGRVEGDLEIMRGDLCLILKEHVGDIEYLFGDSITRISQNENSIHVEFEKNKAREFDLVIGADGLHSVVRKLVFKNEPDFVKELGIYVSVYSLPNYLHLDRWELEYFGEQRWINVYSLHKDLQASFAFAAKPLQFDPQNREEQEELLRKAFKNVGWEAPRLLAFINDSPDFYFDYAAQIKMPHWSEGRVSLVGDAAYAPSPVSGQGTSVAIVGAYVLAGELYENCGDHLKAFSEYEKKLQKFAKKNQDLASMSVEFLSDKDSSWIAWISDFLHKLLPVKSTEFMKARGVDRIHEAANDLQLKNYPSTSKSDE
jgi:2-polyprenyl-6-methoxyphenol hydroxylase-like FAD-dependent oxidoreductase